MVTVTTVDEIKFKTVLNEKGLPLKMGVRLTSTEYKIHTIICETFNVTQNASIIDMPLHVYRKVGNELKKLWIFTPLNQANGKISVRVSPTEPTIKTVLKTALTKDKTIFNPKISHPTQLHQQWGKYLQQKTPQTSPTVDWSYAEKLAKNHHETTKKAILDGKTFNAHKDNPWARKHLKNKNNQ